MTLGTSKENNDWQVLTISISLVLKSFTKKRFITEYSEFRSFLVNGQTSKQYNRIGKHLLSSNCKIISYYGLLLYVRYQILERHQRMIEEREITL